MNYLQNNIRYRRFIKSRDYALEKVLENSRIYSSILLMKAKKEIIETVYYWWGYSNNQDSDKGFLSRVNVAFDRIKPELIANYKRLKKKARILAMLGEAEALSRSAISKRVTVDVSGGSDLAFDGTDIEDRVDLYLMKLSHKIVLAFKQGKVLKDDALKVIARIEKAFPRLVEYQKPKKLLAQPKIKESKKEGFSYTVPEKLDRDLWNEIIQELLNDFIPLPRGEETVLKMIVDSKVKELFDWELERDMVTDFITEVRSGQVDAANQAGVQDFVWISVIDNATDDCCSKRDGLLVSEIEKKLKREWKRDDCDASVPPAHVNCRCTIAPVTSENIPSTEGVDLEDFNAWLRQN